MQIAVARVMVLIEPDEIVWDCGVYGLSSRVCRNELQDAAYELFFNKLAG